MNEVIPGLWIGDLRSAQNAENLKTHGIYSILTAMRGRISIHETFIRHQILVDDTEDADILTHFLPSIHFIQAELDKGRGVLVHCQAGVSRSSTIVAAYLMYSKNIDPHTALELIKKARPFVEPNQGFQQQLELFHATRYKISRQDKAIRMFYMGRAVEEVMNGDGSPPETEMFAKYPRTPSDSLPNTPGGPRRRIRCKMCRQELATREHMLDHGQLGPATPAGTTPATSRRPSASSGSLSRSHSGSALEQARRSARTSFSTVLGDSLTLSSIHENHEHSADPIAKSNSSTSAEATARNTPLIPDAHPLRSLRNSASEMDPSQSFSALEIEDENESEPPRGAMHIDLAGATPESISRQAAELIGQQLSDAVISTPRKGEAANKENDGFFVAANEGTISEYSSAAAGPSISPPVTHLMSPSDLAGQLLANPKLAALRSPSLPTNTPQTPITRPTPTLSGPILINPKCSGYFVEPMKWMDHFLSSGQLAGKITCPNKKCGAKLGNFDWAGQCCGCKEWVTPGFCINRSKVDEVV